MAASQKRRRERAWEAIASRYDLHAEGAADLLGAIERKEDLHRFLVREDHRFDGGWYTTCPTIEGAIRDDLMEECADDHPIDAIWDLDRMNPAAMDMPLRVRGEFLIRVPYTL